MGLCPDDLLLENAEQNSVDAYTHPDRYLAGIFEKNGFPSGLVWVGLVGAGTRGPEIQGNAGLVAFQPSGSVHFLEKNYDSLVALKIMEQQRNKNA